MDGQREKDIRADRNFFDWLTVDAEVLIGMEPILSKIKLWPAGYHMFYVYPRRNRLKYFQEFSFVFLRNYIPIDFDDDFAIPSMLEKVSDICNQSIEVNLIFCEAEILLGAHSIDRDIDLVNAGINNPQVQIWR